MWNRLQYVVKQALAKILTFMNIEKRKILMNAFFNSQFGYCPLTRMFDSQKPNNKINGLHFTNSSYRQHIIVPCAFRI